jgi:hypothetical protein
MEWNGTGGEGIRTGGISDVKRREPINLAGMAFAPLSFPPLFQV